MPRTGRSKAARAQEDAARQQIALQEQALELQRQGQLQQQELLNPFLMAGAEGLQGLIDLSTPEGQAQYFQQYYQSPQFTAQANAAQNAQLASAEAAGGLQSTSTQNQLARIAPTLGTNALQQQQAQLGGLVNTGLSAAGGISNVIGQGAQQQASILGNIGGIHGQIGDIQANKALAPFQTLTGLGGIALGGFAGGLGGSYGSNLFG